MPQREPHEIASTRVKQTLCSGPDDIGSFAGSVSAAEIRALTGVLCASHETAPECRSLIAVATACAMSLEGEAGETWTALHKQEQQLAAISAEGTNLKKNV